MSDLTNMSAVEAVRWFADWSKRERFGITESGVLALLDRGVTDTGLIEKYSGMMLDDLAAIPDGKVTAESLALVDAIGPEVYQADPENAADWAAVAVLVDSCYDPRDIIAGFLTAGRGPSYARQMVEVATRLDKPVDTFGYGEDITPATYADLAPLIDGQTYKKMRALGLSIPEVVAAATDGLTPRAVELAIEEKAPREEWAARYGGLDLEVLDRKYAEGAYAADDLRYLRDKGWDAAPRGSGYSVGATNARLLADAGISYEEYRRWHSAMTDSGRRTAPAISGLDRSDTTACVTACIRLKGLGVSPSHLDEWRQSGCRSVDSIRRVIDAGVTFDRLKAIRREYGTGEHRYDRKKLLTGPDQIIRLANQPEGATV